MTATNQTQKAKQYLTFTLGQSAFAIETDLVREVLEYLPITKVPRLPPHLTGVINLRGGIISIIDLHVMLAADIIDQTADTCIIIVEVTAGQDSLKMGLMADSVQEVIYYRPDQIEPPPALGTKINPAFMRGIVSKDDQYAIILNIEKVLAVVEADVVAAD
jgi:purine-binding chemotaxis protein CheW